MIINVLCILVQCVYIYIYIHMHIHGYLVFCCCLHSSGISHGVLGVRFRSIKIMWPGISPSSHGRLLRRFAREAFVKTSEYRGARESSVELIAVSKAFTTNNVYSVYSVYSVCIYIYSVYSVYIYIYV